MLLLIDAALADAALVLELAQEFCKRGKDFPRGAVLRLRTISRSESGAPEASVGTVITCHGCEATSSDTACFTSRAAALLPERQLSE